MRGVVVLALLLFSAVPMAVAQSVVPDADSLLFLSFNTNFAGAQGEMPAVAPPAGVTLVEGVRSNAAHFILNNYLTYTAAANFSSTSGALDFWIRPNWYGTNGVGQMFFDYPNVTNGVGFLKDGGTALRAIFWEHRPTGYTETDFGYGIGNWQSNEWHHVAFTWDTNALRLYVDTHLLRERLPPYYMPSITGPYLYAGGSGGMSANGAMDEIQVSARPRTAAEILDRVVSSASNRSFAAVEILAVTSPLTLYETWTTIDETMLKGHSSAGAVHLPPEAGTWISADTNIATVDTRGRITAVASGETTVAVSAGGASTTLVVRVRAPFYAPTNEPIDALLATPATNCLYEVPVVIIQYLPTTNGTALDYAEAGVSWTLSYAKSAIEKQAIQSKFMLEEGSRFRGYKAIRAGQPEPPPSIGYRVIDYITVYEPLPSGVLAGGTTYYPHYGQILQRFGGDHYVNDLGVREFWVWGYHYGRIAPVEWYIATPAVPDIADYFDSVHSVLKPIMPVYEKTYTLYHYNFTRSMNECVHDHGHQLEGVMSYFSMRQENSQDFFWKFFVGPTVVGGVTNRRCGWTHMPPNTFNHYDYANATWTNADIEDWRPAGGNQTNLNYTTWRDVGYPWPSGYEPWSSQKSEAHWYVYWMQNMPGLSNVVPHTNDHVMTDWWAFTGNWDDSLEAGMGLHVSPVDLSVSWSGPTNLLEEELCVYTLSITNQGPRTGTNLFLRNTLPAALEPLSATSSVGTCSISNGEVYWQVPSLADGAAAVVTVGVQAVRSGYTSNTAIATAPWQETDARDNRVTWRFAVSDDNDGDGLPNWWERLYFDGPTNATGQEDTDGDGMSNSDEYLADTDPTTNASVFAVAGAASGGDHVLSFMSSTGRQYLLDYRTNLLSGSWTPLRTNLGVGAVLVVTNASLSPSLFYRLKASFPGE